MAFSSPYPVWKYDVFLSFCGVDTRRNFVSHLYRELNRLGIRTFKDDEKLPPGGYITSELFEAIKESKFAVVVISENYVFSEFCLHELAEIVKYREKGSLTILPIFYNVDASNARTQKRSFHEAFEKHEKENPDNVRRWREALTKAANIVGYYSNNWKDDSVLIQKISEQILNWRNASLQSGFCHLVGMDVHMQELEPLLSLGSKSEIRALGICGMGGIGKTEIARYIYKRHYHQFQAFCFIDNVKEIHKSGNAYLQQHFLSEIFQESGLKIPNYIEGSDAIKVSLRQVKVLVVLDDIDHQDQLDILVGNMDGFGPGSRIIVTSRGRDNFPHQYLVYDVKYLKDDDAIQLFSIFAFGKRYPEDAFFDLSTRAVKYAGGLPLALKVWGQFFKGKHREELEMGHFELERCLSQGIMGVLRISYERLQEEAKQIFLYIACFFKLGHHYSNELDSIERLVTLLGARYDNVKYWIGVLANKSLVYISSCEKVEMHDLLQQMGRELSCQQYIDQPGKRKFLFDSAEIYEVLTYATGTEAVEALSLNLSEIHDLYINKKAFKRMLNLRFLVFSGTCFRGNASKVRVDGLNYLSHKLVYLWWNQFPLSTLPLEFHPKCLVELHMPESNLERLWEGPMRLWSLKVMNLQYSEKLKQIPDLTMASNLEVLWLGGCSNLVDVSSISGLQKLASLDFAGCRMLEYLPSFRNMKSLYYLDLGGCSSLRIFPDFSPSSKELHLRDTAIGEVSPSIGLLLALERLDMSNCKIRTIPKDIENLSNLMHLSFYGCSSLVEISSIRGLQNLVRLNFSNCIMLESLPSFRNMKSLQVLYLSGCPSLKMFPEVSPSIRVLTMCDTAIEEVPSSIGLLSGLERLDLSNCKIRNISSDIGNLRSLRYLNLSGCYLLMEIPKTIQKMQSLQTLKIRECKLLRSLPELPRSLQYLEATGNLSLAEVDTVNIVPKREAFYSSWFPSATNMEHHEMPRLHYKAEVGVFSPRAVRYSLTFPVALNRRMVGFLMSFAVVVKTNNMGKPPLVRYLDKPMLVTDLGFITPKFWGSYVNVTENPMIFGHYFEKPEENTRITFHFSLEAFYEEDPEAFYEDDCSLKIGIKDFRFRPIFIEGLDETESNGSAAQSSFSYCHIMQEDLMYGNPAAESESGEEEEQEPSFKRLRLF